MSVGCNETVRVLQRKSHLEVLLRKSHEISPEMGNLPGS